MSILPRPPSPSGFGASRQPDDPGPSPANPYAPVRFEDSIAGRQTAWLGSILIGEVAPNTGGRFQKASALLHLPHVARRQFPASSLGAAQAIVAREVHDWIDRSEIRAWLFSQIDGATR